MRIYITNVLVDDQDKALKFYTEVLGGRVFFEVVQRIEAAAVNGETPIERIELRRVRVVRPAPAVPWPAVGASPPTAAA